MEPRSKADFTASQWKNKGQRRCAACQSDAASSKVEANGLDGEDLEAAAGRTGEQQQQQCDAYSKHFRFGTGERLELPPDALVLEPLSPVTPASTGAEGPHPTPLRGVAPSRCGGDRALLWWWLFAALVTLMTVQWATMDDAPAGDDMRPAVRPAAEPAAASPPPPPPREESPPRPRRAEAGRARARLVTAERAAKPAPSPTSAGPPPAEPKATTTAKKSRKAKSKPKAEAKDGAA